jgi:hypothetical protein
MKRGVRFLILLVVLLTGVLYSPVIGVSCQSVADTGPCATPW